MRRPVKADIQVPDKLLNGCRRQTQAWINFRHWGMDARRSGSRLNSYVDKYETPLIVAVVVILICSVLDAKFTLLLMSKGAVELNVLMAYLIEGDHSVFVQLKISLTALSIILLVVHKNFQLVRRFRVGHLVYLIATFYVGLIGYELFLLNLVV